MKNLTNLSSKVIHLSLAKEHKINGVKTKTIELTACETLPVPDEVLGEKIVKTKIENGILKTDGKLSESAPKPSNDPPKPPNDPPKGESKGGGSSTGSKKS